MPPPPQSPQNELLQATVSNMMDPQPLIPLPANGKKDKSVQSSEQQGSDAKADESTYSFDSFREGFREGLLDWPQERKAKNVQQQGEVAGESEDEEESYGEDSAFEMERNALNRWLRDGVNTFGDINHISAPSSVSSWLGTSEDTPPKPAQVVQPVPKHLRPSAELKAPRSKQSKKGHDWETISAEISSSSQPPAALPLQPRYPQPGWQTTPEAPSNSSSAQSAAPRVARQHPFRHPKRVVQTRMPRRLVCVPPTPQPNSKYKPPQLVSHRGLLLVTKSGVSKPTVPVVTVKVKNSDGERSWEQLLVDHLHKRPTGFMEGIFPKLSGRVEDQINYGTSLEDRKRNLQLRAAIARLRPIAVAAVRNLHTEKIARFRTVLNSRYALYSKSEKQKPSTNANQLGNDFKRRPRSKSVGDGPELPGLPDGNDSGDSDSSREGNGLRRRGNGGGYRGRGRPNIGRGEPSDPAITVPEAKQQSRFYEVMLLLLIRGLVLLPIGLTILLVAQRRKICLLEDILNLWVYQDYEFKPMVCPYTEYPEEELSGIANFG
ncbi:hypothetical protein BDZ91DRAFT_723990 [Kalaharituber pfeilii]|nr:hypothetical protein BDZ91DRAFT_723990 [Kalaharituber pfeilii]